jgi:putative ABC transport system permease protein
MIRLLLAELRREWRAWVGLFIAVFVTGALLSLSFGVYLGAISAGEAGRDVVSTATAVSWLNGISGVVVLSSSAVLTVTRYYRRFALWRLAGFTPRQVRWSALIQITVVALVAATASLPVSIPLLEPAFDVLNHFDGVPDAARAAMVPSVAWILASVGGTVAVTVLGASRAIRRAGRAEPIAALRETDAAPAAGAWRRLGWMRWTLAGLSAGVLVLALWLTAITPAPENLSSIFLLGPSATGLVVSLAPVILPGVLGLWTRVVPDRLSAAWFLARTHAEHRLTMNVSTVSPIVSAALLVGSIFALNDVALKVIFRGDPEGARDALAGSDWVAIISLIAGPIILAATGATVTVMASNRSRNRDLALVTTAGGTKATAVLTALFESVIYAGTALVISVGTIVLLATVTTLVASFNAPGIGLEFTVLPTLLICGFGFLLLAVATTAPILSAGRRSPLRALSDD